MSNSSTLILITSRFPADTLTEPTFVMPELKALSKRFGKIVVMPMVEESGLPQISLSNLKNVSVSFALARYPFWRHKYLRPILLLHPEGLRSLMTGRPEEITYAAGAVAVAMAIRSLGLDPSSTLVYSYWFESQAAGAVLSGFPAIVRAHGHDVWSERGRRLRDRTLRDSLGTFVVSEAGAAWLRGQYPAGAAKIHVSRIGSVKIYPATINTGHKTADRRLTFLTCSRCAPEKRVDLIYKFVRAIAIARPATEVKWIYVGDGPHMNILKEAIDKNPPVANMKADLRGSMVNSDVQKIYTSEPVDWYIMLSTTEGLPISICEALSYGVPVITTDVGGIPELIDDSCGVLLPPDVEKEEFIRGLVPYLDSDYRTAALRTAAFERWKEEADADHLSSLFAETVSKLFSGYTADTPNNP